MSLRFCFPCDSPSHASLHEIFTTSQFLSLKDLKQNKGSNFVKLTQDPSQDIILKL